MLLARLVSMPHLPHMTPQLSKLLLGVACYTGASLLVAAYAEKKHFSHVFKQLGQ